MIRFLRGLPSLQRRLFFVLFAFGIVVLVYLLITNNENFHDKPGSSKIIDIIKARDSVTDKMIIAERLPSEGKLTFDEQLPEVKANSEYQGEPPVGLKMNLPEQDSNTEVEVPPADKAEPGPTRDSYQGPQNEKQKQIVDAFLHAWKGYKKYAWGHDELRPLSQSYQEWFGGIGLTMVDSLDTMYIMGLKKEFKEARDWIEKNLSFEKNTDAQLFEIVIRALGGLLSAYHLSGDKVFADKALELGNKLMPCFKGTTKVPCNRINLLRGQARFSETSTAEIGTIQLEFRDLSRVTGDNKFEGVASAVSDHIHSLQKLDGLVACFISPYSGNFRASSTVSAGASADSYYEYLLKQWLQTGKTKDWLKTDYQDAIKGIKKHLIKTTHPNKLKFVGALTSMYPGASFRPEMEHLTCFLPGLMAMGHSHGLGEDHLDLAKDITKTCYEMYRTMPTGLGPEVAAMNQRQGSQNDISIAYGAQHNLQRPETVESIFYLYRVTKDPIYREWGWNIFQSFEKHTKVKDGYASINSVMQKDNPQYRDKMETFYLAETLKYLYLLFSDDPNLIPLDKWVFNTEAHPLPVYNK